VPKENQGQRQRERKGKPRRTAERERPAADKTDAPKEKEKLSRETRELKQQPPSDHPVEAAGEAKSAGINLDELFFSFELGRLDHPLRFPSRNVIESYRHAEELAELGVAVRCFHVTRSEFKKEIEAQKQKHKMPLLQVITLNELQKVVDAAVENSELLKAQLRSLRTRLRQAGEPPLIMSIAALWAARIGALGGLPEELFEPFAAPKRTPGLIVLTIPRTFYNTERSALTFTYMLVPSPYAIDMLLQSENIIGSPYDAKLPDLSNGEPVHRRLAREWGLVEAFIREELPEQEGH